MEGLPPYATEKNYIEAKQIVAKLFIDMEISVVISDEFGRIKYRIDYSTHGNDVAHTNPHIHEFIGNTTKGNYSIQEKRYFLDESNLKWYLISKTNGETIIKYYGYLSRMYPIAIMMEDCPNEILKILFKNEVIVEKYYEKYKCNEKILSRFVDKIMIDDGFLYNDKIPFNEELFNVIDDGVEYINPCGFRFEELLN